MHRWTAALLALPLLLSSLLNVKALDLDAHEREIRLQCEAETKWEVIACQPWLVSGCLPEKECFCLSEGKEVIVRIPAHSALRVFPQNNCSCGALSVSFSNGSGAFVRANPTSTSAGGLVFRPHLPLPMLARIVSCSETQCFSLSYQVPDSGKVSVYRDEIPLCTCESQVTILPKPGAENKIYHRVDQNGARLPLEPGRYRLESRLVYSEDQTSISQNYSVHVGRGDRVVSSVDLLTNLETRAIVFPVENCDPLLVGQKQISYFNLCDPGEYCFYASQPVLMRLHRMDHNPFLHEKNDYCVDPATADYDLEQNLWNRALGVARDNARPGGGLYAADIFLDNAPDGFAGRELLGAGETFTRSFSSFKSLYPEHIPSRVQYTRFLTPLLESVDTQAKQLEIEDQHLEAALRYLSDAPFVTLQDQLVYRRSYDSPETSRVRLVALQDGLTQNVEVDLIINNAAPVRFTILPKDTLADKPRSEIFAEAGLERLEEMHTSSAAGTLDYAYSHRQSPAPLIDVGFYEIPVDGRVQTIRVKRICGPCVKVAVQVRQGRDYSLRHGEIREAITCQGGIDAARNALFRFLADEDCRSGVLTNQWFPLRRFIASRYDSVKDSLQSGPVPADLERERLDLAADLIEQRDVILAKKVLKSLLVFSDRSGTRQRAANLLKQINQLSPDPEDLLLIECTALMAGPTTEGLKRVATLLWERGDYQLAAGIVAVLPGHQDVLDTALGVSLKIGDTATFREWSESFPQADETRFYTAYRDWNTGEYDSAIQSFNAAGAKGQRFASYIRDSKVIRDTLSGDLLNGWASWQNRHPGRQIWGEAKPDIVAGTIRYANVKAIARGSVVRSYYIKQGDALTLAPFAPANLRLEIRPVHPAGSEQPVEGWISVSGQGETNHLPVINNFATDALELQNIRGAVGAKIQHDLFYPGGDSTVKVRSSDFPLLVRVLEQTPILPIGYLPRLTLETAEELTGGHSLRFPRLPGVHGNADNALLSEANNHLRAFENTDVPEEKMRHFVSVRGLVDANPDFIELTRPMGKMERQLRWNSVLNIDDSAGSRIIETDGWIPENPDLLARMAFLPRLKLNEQLVMGSESMAISLTNALPRDVTVNVEAVCPDFVDQGSIDVTVARDGEPVQRLTVTAGDGSRSVNVSMPAGRGSLEVSVGRAPPYHYLKVGLSDSREGIGEMFARKTKREWHAGTRDRPVELRIAGPAVIRIDERVSDSETRHEYRSVPGEVATITKAPLSGTGLYRFHEVSLDPEKPYFHPEFQGRDVSGVPNPPSMYYDSGNYTIVEPLYSGPGDGDYEIVERYRGYLEGQIAWAKRRDAEEDLTGAQTAERFLQTSLTWRYFDPENNNYWKINALGRNREDGDPVFGMKATFEEHSDYLPFFWGATGGFFVQDGESIFNTSAYLGDSFPVANRIDASYKITGFARSLSLDNSGGTPALIDQDIFTKYKDDHQHGLRLASRMTYTPHEDTKLYVGGFLGTNEDYNFFQPDVFRSSVGARQLLGPVYTGAEYRYFHYFEDGDRRSDADRHQLRFNLAYDWHLSQSRTVELGANWIHFVNEPNSELRNAFLLHLTVPLGQGDSYYHDMPGETPFSSLRQR